MNGASTMRKPSYQPSFATITALLALVVALSGTSYAFSLPNDSVRSRHIKDGTVNGKDIKPGVLPDSTTTVQFAQAAADLLPGGAVEVAAFCPSGQMGVGGGVRGDQENPEVVTVTASRPVATTAGSAPGDGQTFTGWRGGFVNTDDGSTPGIRPEVWVVCLAS